MDLGDLMCELLADWLAQQYELRLAPPWRWVVDQTADGLQVQIDYVDTTLGRYICYEGEFTVELDIDQGLPAVRASCESLLDDLVEAEGEWVRYAMRAPITV